MSEFLVPVILSGGAGTRLWPLSRESHPKPFMKLADGDSLLVKTYQRAARVARGDEILTVTNRDYYFMSKDEFASANAGDRLKPAFLLEPSGRNTAPAVALAAHHVAERFGREAILLVLAADHLIQKEDAFIAAVSDATHLAADDFLVTFGILPTGPETGFGYIELGESLVFGNRVSSFKEKPDLTTATAYVNSGRYLWNSGMFCFKAGTMLDELALHAPDVSHAAAECWSTMCRTGGPMQEIPAELFAELPAVPIDIAVMERSNRVAVVPADIEWSDIGSWNAVSDLAEPDESGNRGLGEVIFVDTGTTFVKSEDRLVATVGIDDLLIIDTPDALLVAHKDRAQDVKEVVNRLKQSNHAAYRLHRSVARPWGTYTILEEGPRFKIKRIEVRPGRSLSIQMHHHRSEHWVVVSGMAKVTNGEKELFVRSNESTYIPAGQRHRLENPGLLDLVMIEVQSGEYLGEDDIVRFEDDYGRA
jgi:mannose-1-phosphate guanylyltransferase/mannose-6-phosphate isomerase